ncbi:hypothetical protein SLS62_003771 [Diatrype stigma]|uniref:Vacuolar ATPase assembly protein VMA22 n=1 Tax=Diatrype stigma TaxID=117547 RepID=A0AAN9URU1_9PEZI
MDTDANATSSNIDALLERYLHLLHEYTALRERLGTLQAGVYQNLARANFAAERGVRYGQDHYDGRMQASRRVRVRVRVAVAAAAAAPSFAVTLEKEGEQEQEKEDPNPTPRSPSADDEASGSGVSGGLDGSEEGTKKKAGGDGDGDGGVVEEGADGAEQKPKKQTQTRSSKDPLRWFGLLAPLALRQAQAQSVQAVEEVVPRLASIDAEMAQVEIEVRRARKKRAKAEAKKKLEQEQEQQPAADASTRAGEVAA